MEKRYQVFVSSTYEDLQSERQEVMHALLELDCIPAGMELFPAADEDQWTLIKKVVDDCDYYVVVLAGRYGSIGPDGVGYTEMEYRYAQEARKPSIAFLHKHPDELPAKFTEHTPEGRKKLDEFRAALEARHCKYWTTPSELGSVVSRSLIKLIKTRPMVGWVRANDVLSTEAAAEILGLHRRVVELEGELARVRETPPVGTEKLAQGKDMLRVEFQVWCKERGPEGEVTSVRRMEEIPLSWDDIFAAVGPAMIHEGSDYELRKLLNEAIGARAPHTLRENGSIEAWGFEHFQITDGAYHTVIVQLRALGLVSTSTRQHGVRDRENYWSLTPYGDAVMMKLRALRRQENE